MDDHQLFALPGFLGLPQDWHLLFQRNSNVDAVDIFSALPILNFWEWAEQFNKMIQQKNLLIQRRFLMGYSLGGRLALHLLLQNTPLWQAAVLISTHPGLKNPEEKKQRLKLDEEWAGRFASSSWDSLMRDWNDQEIFQTDPFKFERLEKNYSRDRLSQALRTWSLGNQEDLQSRIEELNLPILWITGAQDERYSFLANQMNLKHPLSKVLKIPLAGHRAPWQQQGIFQDQINQFLKRAI